MSNTFKIALDHVNSVEYFLTYTKKMYIQNYEGKTFYHFEPDKAICKPIGNLFIEFINLNFNNETTVKDFFSRYLFIPLLLSEIPTLQLSLDFYKLKKLPEKPEVKMNTIILSEEEYEKYYNQIYEKYLKRLKKFQKEYQAVAELKHNEYLSKLLGSAIIEESNIKETYQNTVNALCQSTIFELNIRFDIECTFENSKLQKDIPFYFSTGNFEEILIITLRELVTYCKYFRVQICENCNKYFIPRTAHTTYYCDEIFRNNVTCKQIGSEIKHKRTLEKDELLREYRKRYCSLSKEVSCYKNPKIAEIFENYKKEGKIMRKKYVDGKLQGDLFKQWIQKSYIKK